MARLALVTPLPPASTGIADYSALLAGLLSGRHEVALYHDQAEHDQARLPGACPVYPGTELAARHRERPYDLVLYQLGNATAHDFVYDLLSRLPGLLVLHDLVLHHARALRFLDSPAARAYAANPASAALREAARAPLAAYADELSYCYPKQGSRVAETHLATVGDLLPYAYPLFRIPVEASRATVVHNAFMADAVREEVPDASVHRVPMAVEAPEPDPKRARALRARLGIATDDVVVASFGLLTREKRVESVARAVARAAVRLPGLRLLLVGPVPDREHLAASLARLGVARRTIVTGRVPFEELLAHVEAADVVAHLRYPTARETSAALLRVLAQGRATVVSDVEHLAEIPEDAVLRVDTTDEEGELTRAILRLAGRPELRARLGRRAREFVLSEHSEARFLDAYEEAIAAARARSAPAPRPWPAHWRRPQAARD